MSNNDDHLKVDLPFGWRMSDSLGYNHVNEHRHRGMVDWLTLRLGAVDAPVSALNYFRGKSPRLMKVTPHGSIEWESVSILSVRSDSHKMSIRAGKDLVLMCSPARMGDRNNVFGSLDLRYCATKMIEYASWACSTPLPGYQDWTCSRIDVTRNYALQSLYEAKQAMLYLKSICRVRQGITTYEDAVYVGRGSTLHEGKIYLKGQDARRNNKNHTAIYSPPELAKCDKMVRVEYKISRGKIFEFRDSGVDWYDLLPDKLIELHTNYFKEYLTGIEVVNMDTVLEKLLVVSPTPGRARAAYDCWARIRLLGFEQSKVSYAVSTWNKHLALLRKSGVAREQMTQDNVVNIPLKRPVFGRALRDWDEIPLEV